MAARIWDAIVTLLTGKPWSCIQLDRAIAEVRELNLEVASTLEKLNAWSARLRKRENRQAREMLSEPAPNAPVSHDPNPFVQALTPKQRLRQRLREGLPATTVGVLGRPASIGGGGADHGQAAASNAAGGNES